MGRMMRSWPAALAASIAILVLSTCSNGVNFRAEVVDEVMKANDLYLEVVEVTPPKNQTSVNTWGSLLVEFDREIDPDTVSDSTISISPDVDWTYSYDPLTRILSITPEILEGTTPYTVSVSEAVTGVDGSSLRDPYSWSFTTKAAPGGTIVLSDADAPNAEYSNAVGVTCTINANILTTAYRISTSDPPGFPAAPDITGYVPIITTATVAVTLPASDGLKKVYIQFMIDENNMTPPIAIFDTITLDTVNPTATSISIASGATYTNTTSVSLDIVASDSNGLAQMQFSNDFGAFSTYETFNATRTGWSLVDSQGSRSVRVRVKDNAGNESSSLPLDTITLDSVGPIKTTFNINSDAGYTNSTSSTLTIAFTDATTGVNQVRYGNKGYAYTAWEAYATSKAWTLTTGDATKTVFIQVSDFAGNVTTVSDAIVLDQTPPTISVFTVGSGNPASTNSTSVTLYITASDGTGSGLYQSRYGNYGQSWTAWEAYAATKAWTLQDVAGTRRVYLGVKDNLGNETAANGTWDEILLNARIVVTYHQLTITNDGDNELLTEGLSGEIYYTFYIDGVTKLYRLGADYITLTSTATIPPGTLPQSSYTIYKNPTSGSFTMTGTVYDQDFFSADDTGTMASVTYSAPFTDYTNVNRAIGGAVAGAIYYSIDFVNP
jgi:hypothetical protein